MEWITTKPAGYILNNLFILDFHRLRTCTCFEIYLRLWQRSKKRCIVVNSESAAPYTDSP